jgi:hypothetical protein
MPKYVTQEERVVNVEKSIKLLSVEILRLRAQIAGLIPASAIPESEPEKPAKKGRPKKTVEETTDDLG